MVYPLVWVVLLANSVSFIIVRSVIKLIIIGRVGKSKMTMICIKTSWFDFCQSGHTRVLLKKVAYLKEEKGVRFVSIFKLSVKWNEVIFQLAETICMYIYDYLLRNVHIIGAPYSFNFLLTQIEIFIFISIFAFKNVFIIKPFVKTKPWWMKPNNSFVKYC